MEEVSVFFTYDTTEIFCYKLKCSVKYSVNLTYFSLSKKTVPIGVCLPMH